MAAQLIALTDGRVIQVDKGILVIGRHVECDVQILSPKVSRLHCCIAQVGNYLVIRDLNSTNGIRINGLRVIEGRVGAGDELAIGTHRYRVRGEGLAPSPDVHRPADDKRKAAAEVAKKDLDSFEEPVALPEPAGRPVRKAKKNLDVEPVPEPEKLADLTEPPMLEPLAETPPPVLEEHSSSPAPPEPLELLSFSDEFPKPSPPS